MGICCPACGLSGGCSGNITQSFKPIRTKTGPHGLQANAVLHLCVCRHRLDNLQAFKCGGKKKPNAEHEPMT